MEAECSGMEDGDKINEWRKSKDEKDEVGHAPSGFAKTGLQVTLAYKWGKARRGIGTCFLVQDGECDKGGVQSIIAGCLRLNQFSS